MKGASMTHSSPREKNTYFIATDNAAELARLIVQGRQMTKDMGGIMVEQTDVSALYEALDLACGPGEWALDFARQYPEKTVMGVDIEEQMIRYANALIDTSGQDNASFEVMDITQKLPIPDQSFDLVNARLLAGVLSRAAWPALLHEAWRVLRPGGRIRLSEIEVPSTTSESFERLNRISALAMHRAGYGFSPDGHNFGVAMMLEPLLTAAGFSGIQSRAHPVALLKGRDAHQAHYENLRIVYPNLLPLMLKTKATHEEEFQMLYKQSMLDLQTDDFYGLVFILTVWGVK